MVPASGLPTGGFLLSLLTESFAVRALLGSLVAAGLAAIVVRRRLVRTRAARRLVVLAPVTTAAAAAIWSLWDAEAYLPVLWLTSAGAPAAGQLLQLLGEWRVMSPASGGDLLVAAWGLVAGVLVTRRAVGLVTGRRLVRMARPVPAGHPLEAAAARMAAALGPRHVRVLLLDGCPGGAFTTGFRHPVVVVDPALTGSLDARELEGLVAHELAHAVRRDPLVGVLVGVFSDLTFFLPTVSLAARWLRREQEESADELASTATRRPAALASGILKVWERAAAARQPAGACAAVPATRLAGVGGVALQWLREEGHTPAPPLLDRMRVVTARVERLLAPSPATTAARQRAEVGLAVALLTVAVGVAVVVPGWIAADLDAEALSFGYVPPPAVPQESPAFATFRALSPERPSPQVRRRAPLAVPPVASAAGDVAGCPCIETQAQLAAASAATIADAEVPAMAWSRPGRAPWEVGPDDESRRARPLWTLRESGPAVGVFVVARDGAS